MNNHVTSRRPPWRTVLLGFLGFTDLPIKVNCWYCSQDSYLLPGGKQTERYWHCNICENTNVKDENGDIVDTLPVMYDAKLNRTVTPIQDTSRKFQTRRLCESCERNQALIYQIMSDYIRDENDPDYDYYLRTADDYKTSLHQKYALCDDCQLIVDEIVAEQKAALRQRRFNEKLTRSLTTKAPRKPSKFEYGSMGLLWIWLHGMTWLICFYAFWYPPIRHNEADLITDIKGSWEAFATYFALSTISIQNLSLKFTFSQVAKSGLMFVIQRISYMGQILHNYTVCLVAPEKEESCQWDVSNHATLFLIVCLISFIWMNWHPKASKTYFEESRIQRWGIYTNIQRFLYVARLGLLLVLCYAHEQIIHVIMEITLIIMPLVNIAFKSR
ncbi:Ima1 N-terminal domain-containing protein [Phascolomyces articulosus]|uniref:Ima1 N-terminal domain-containing protein n=1 Tax=Phascolomyces articulosus TaxID=60185 RepID=A0AAD5K2N1_9FUNG|nr:Ima1 N-terminal domain-containing protein [Phascolomyces articulosus]